MSTADFRTPLGPWGRFWFTPIDPLPLHRVRFLTGLLLVGWLVGLMDGIPEYLGRDGIVDATAYRALDAIKGEENVPISWGHHLVAPGNFIVLQYWATMAIFILLTLGVATRLSAPLAWLGVVAFTSNPATYDAGDQLLAMLTLYLSLGYVLMNISKITSPTAWLGVPTASIFQHREPRPPSTWANIAIRLIQIHFCAIIFISALHKLQEAEWWAGDALWYPLHPPFSTQVQEIIDKRGEVNTFLVCLSLATYGTLLWQLSFPFIAWMRVGRWIVVGGAILGWMWNTLVADVPTFGMAYFIAAVSFLPAKWPERKD